MIATRRMAIIVNSESKLFLQKSEKNRLSTPKQPDSNPSTDVTFDNDLEHLTTLETAKRGKWERKASGKSKKPPSQKPDG